MSYLGFKYVGLDRVLLGSGYDVSADFTDSGGIFVNAEVTYRGVSVGRVTDMKLIDDGVRVVLSIDPRRRADPGRHRGRRRQPQRGGGAVRRPAAAHRPGPVPEGRLGHPDEPHRDPRPGRAARCCTSTRWPARSTATTCAPSSSELGKAFDGAGDDLGRLIDNGNLLLARAEQSLPQTLKLITDGQTVLDTQMATARRSSSGPHDLRLVTDTLVQMDPDIRAARGQRPGRRRRPAAAGPGRRPGPGLAGAQPRHPQRRHHPAAGRASSRCWSPTPTSSPAASASSATTAASMRAHFGFVLNDGDPRACTSGYVSTGQTPTPAAVAVAEHRHRSSATVINGVDPNPGDGIDETGSDIRGAQNIGRSGGQGAPEPAPGRAVASTAARHVLNQMLGSLLGANSVLPTTSTLSQLPARLLPTVPSSEPGRRERIARQRRISRVTSEARARPAGAGRRRDVGRGGRRGRAGGGRAGGRTSARSDEPAVDGPAAAPGTGHRCDGRCRRRRGRRAGVAGEPPTRPGRGRRANRRSADAAAGGPRRRPVVAAPAAVAAAGARSWRCCSCCCSAGRRSSGSPGRPPRR